MAARKIVHYLNEKALKDVRIRLRGDNPDNWLKEKQSFRTKLRKRRCMGDRGITIIFLLKLEF